MTYPMCRTIAPHVLHESPHSRQHIKFTSPHTSLTIVTYHRRGQSHSPLPSSIITNILVTSAADIRHLPHRYDTPLHRLLVPHLHPDLHIDLKPNLQIHPLHCLLILSLEVQKCEAALGGMRRESTEACARPPATVVILY